MKTKSYLKQSREKYIDNDIEGSLISLSYAYTMGSDVAAVSILNMIEMNLDRSDPRTPKLGTFRLVLPEEQTNFLLNSFLLSLSSNAYYFSVLADSLYQNMIFPVDMKELYKSGNVAGTILDYQNIARSQDPNLPASEKKQLESALKTGLVQNIESRKNSYRLYERSYAARQDMYSLYSMGYMQEHGLGVEKNLKEAHEKYKVVLKKGFSQLFGSKKNLSSNVRRAGFAEVLSASAGLAKIYLKSWILSDN